MTDAPVKPPCGQRHLLPLCETLWHTLCNSVSDGYLLDCFVTCLLRRPAAIRDKFAAERTHDAYSRSRFVYCWASPNRSIARAIAFGNAAGQALPGSMCEGSVEPPRRQVAKQ